MSSVSIKPDTKSRWDELKPEELTHDEFAQEVLDAFEHGDEPVYIDTEEIVKEAALTVAGECETAAYRGVKDALNQEP